MLQAGVIQKKAVVHLGATQPKAKPVDVARVKAAKNTLLLWSIYTTAFNFCNQHMWGEIMPGAERC